MVDLIIIIGATMPSRNLLGCLPLYKSQFLVLSSAKQGIFEYKHIVVLLNLVKIIHIELR